MEKHNCKLCFKQFANGKALGGHMRSHMAILQTPPKTQVSLQRLVYETESVSSSDGGEEEEEEEEEEEDEVLKGGLNYRLRENPRKSFRLVDPLFSSPVDGGSIVLDRESENESFKLSPTRRRSKRNRKSSLGNQILKKRTTTKLKLLDESPVESEEPASSVSDTTPEEDVAFCLMKLSRDVWIKEEEEQVAVVDDDESEDDEEEEEEEINVVKKSGNRKKYYQCESCKKFFRSYQALGGHRANHKKTNRGGSGCCIPSSSTSVVTAKKTSTHDSETQQRSNAAEIDQRLFHECPICFKVFKNRQALGGHKRSHQYVAVSSTPSTPATPPPPPPPPTSSYLKFGNTLIDLNFPAPIEEDQSINYSFKL